MRERAGEVGSLRRVGEVDGMVAERGKLIVCEVERGKLMGWWLSGRS